MVTFQLFIHQPLLATSVIGPKILSQRLFLQRVVDFCKQNVPNHNDKTLLINLEGGLQGVVSSGRGPEPTLDQKTRFIQRDGKIFLHRKYAYPPRSCIVTLVRQDEFRSRFEEERSYRNRMTLPDAFTHMITAINVIDGQSDQGSVMVADF